MATADRVRQLIQQYQSTTGRRIQPEVLQALLTSELDVEAGRQAQNKELELKQEQLKNEAEAAKTSGAIQLGGAAIQGGMLLKDTALGKAIGSGITKGGSAAYNSVFGGAASGTGTGAALTEGSGLSVSGAGGGYVPSAVAGGEAGTAAGGSAGSFSGAATTAGGIAAVVAADQILANKVGGYKSPQKSWEANVRGITRYGGISPGNTAYLEKWTGLDKTPTTGVEKTIASATAGTIPTFFGGSQKGIVPDLGQIADDAGTVICTEMFVQGHIPHNILLLDAQHRVKYISEQAYLGYRQWAVPLVEVMKKSKFVSSIVRPFAVAWAYEMAHRMNPRIKGRILGKVLLKIGVPICSFIGGKGARYAIS